MAMGIDVQRLYQQHFIYLAVLALVARESRNTSVENQRRATNHGYLFLHRIVSFFRKYPVAMV